jgi:serine/threonine-protein kinase haspin
MVQGTYHRRLLAEWDAYADSHGTENVRPSCFGRSQEYVVIFLRDGGADLQAFTFAKKTGWVQAAGVFWQVADALARAEEWAEFEVRFLVPAPPY